MKLTIGLILLSGIPKWQGIEAINGLLPEPVRRLRTTRAGFILNKVASQRAVGELGLNRNSAYVVKRALGYAFELDELLEARPTARRGV